MRRGVTIIGGALALAWLTLALASAPLSRPAVRVEPATATAPGTGPIALRYAEWQSDSTWRYDLATGAVSAILRLRPPSYELLAIDHDSVIAGFLSPKTSVQLGDEAGPHVLQPDIQPNGNDANLDPSYWVAQECFAPLYLAGHGAGTTERHVCAFVRVRIEQVTAPPGGGQPGDLFLRVTKLPNPLRPGTPWVALRNAASRLDGTQPPVVFPNTPLGWDDLRRVLHYLPPVPGGPSVLLPDSRVYVP